VDIRQLLRDLRQNFVAVFLAFAVCAAAGGAAAFLPAKQYTASTELALSVSPTSPDPAGAVALIQYLILQLPTEATSPSTLNAARATLPSSEANANVSVSATAPPSTDVLTITVKANNPHAAADFANAIAAQVKALQPRQNNYEITTLEPATPPTSPSNPTKPILVGAIGFGVIAGVFAGLASAGIRRRFSRVSEVKDRIGANVLGEIPRVISGNIRPSSLFVLGRQPSVMEAFQEVRSNLLLSIPDGPTSIAVTSCDPSEGKTSTVANIAWALAAEGRRITAVDADLRKPMLHLELEVPFGPGLASGGAADALRHASKTTNPYLDVVPAGIPSRHPADVVSAYLPPLLHSLRERDQSVIVDCPPLIGVAETVLIAAMVDMVVVVVDARRLHLERLQQCLLRLDGAGANVVGVVINRTRRRRRAGSYQYGYFGREENQQLVTPAPTPTTASSPARAEPTPGQPAGNGVARTRWLGAPPPAERPVQPAERPVQPVARPTGRRWGSGRPPPFRSPSGHQSEERAPGATGVSEREARRRQPEW
jgi:capsular exopolysaccharide synthesis family protein